MNKTSKIHTIRLQGPWIAKVLVFYRSSNVPELANDSSELQHRCQVPSDWGDWLGNSFRGKVAYDRNFNKPTQLEVDQKVWLVVEAVDFLGEVFLNGSKIGSLVFDGAPMRTEIGALLESSNRLRVEVELPDEDRPQRMDRIGLAGGLIGAVRIEIEETV